MSKTHNTDFPDVPKLFNGEQVFIIGGGASLFLFRQNEKVMSFLRSQKTIAVNGGLSFLPEATAHFFADRVWYLREKQRVDAYSGTKITLDKGAVSRETGLVNFPSIADNPGLTVLPYCSFGWVKEGNVIPFNRSSGAAAINLAHLMGAGSAVLLGYDMRTVDGKAEYYTSPNADLYGRTHTLERWEEKYAPMIYGIEVMMRSMLEQEAYFEVLNASPCSAIPWIKSVSMNEVM